jgi:hypothetical protein
MGQAHSAKVVEEIVIDPAYRYRARCCGVSSKDKTQSRIPKHWG